MESTLYNQDGKENGKITLSKDLFGARWNPDLVHQVTVSMEGNARAPFAHTKDRSDVSGGGKKPWRQKGTGRARHGSIRSPIWIGGGVAHGPRKEKNYSRKINQKMRVGALVSVLSRKFNDGEIFFIDALSLKEPKTKNASAVLKHFSSVNKIDTFGGSSGRRVLIVFSSHDKILEKSFRNIPQVSFEEVRNLNPVLLLKNKYVIFINPKDGLKILGNRLSPSKTSAKIKNL